MRLTTQGSRSLVLVRVMDAIKHLETMGEDRKKITPQRLFDWLKELKSEPCQKFVENWPRSMLQGTVGPNDCLFQPTGWMMWEKIGATEDVYGVKVSAAQLCQQELFGALQQWLAACKKDSQKVGALVDIFTLRS